ncbi:hypothetical protein EJ04DRAFT_539218 [Polyplosphaeria fusca]|uniref:Uncharacterized protein n=1 Tax=Polyplosphaeria fusca TaxID=682080 RepID=A0A9P4QL65_9PLEO|nr:hypothetical protein EJ04DRAFT_539218 [Polyplosphaeria fusca]
MVLRADSWVLFDDGLLYSYVNAFSQDTPDPWNLSNAKYDYRLLRIYMSGSDRRKLEDMASLISDAHPDFQAPFGTIANLLLEIMRLLQSLVEKQAESGEAASDIGYSHAVYSVASRRRATKLHDRIYGIVQTYGIACSPDPPGEDEKTKLHYLEDEFGKKLVTKSPVLSQIFLHGSEHELPRRSWLLTQDCIADDPFWIIPTCGKSSPGDFCHFFQFLRSSGTGSC